jgi:hypothetical protein
MFFLYEHEWLLFLTAEALTWVFALFFCISRYRYRMEHISRLFLVLVGVCTLFQVVLVGVDYYITGKISFFQVILCMFFVYAATLGHSEFVRLDQYIKSRITPYRSENSDEFKTHTLYRLRVILVHTAAFVLLHAIWYIADSATSGLPPLTVFIFNEWIEYPHQGFFSVPELNMLSYFWKVIYYYDLCVFVLLHMRSSLWYNK